MLQRSRKPLRLALRRATFFAALAVVALPAFPSASLQPTHAGLVRQSLGAREAGFSYLTTDEQVHDFVRKGLLVTMRGNADYHIDDDVRFAATRPEVKVFIERLAKQYRADCGEKLVVTSLVRPRNRQPWNSDPLSVHPTGMAVDLRISSSSDCRSWLEDTLLELEGKGLIEAARERVVPHYHVVVFPAYGRFLEKNGVELPSASTTVLASTRSAGPLGLPTAMPAVARVVPAAMTTSMAAVHAVSQNVPAVQRTTAARSSGSTAAKKPATTTRRASTTNAAKRSTSHTSSKRSTSRASAHRATRYKVRNGDNLWTIAKRHGVTVASLRRANRLPLRLKPGQVLAIPAR